MVTQGQGTVMALPTKPPVPLIPLIPPRPYPSGYEGCCEPRPHSEPRPPPALLCSSHRGRASVCPRAGVHPVRARRRGPAQAGMGTERGGPGA